MKQYRLYNNIGGWVSFVVAAIVYLLTIEPTTSFWDCGEFITTAYRLEVGHPPGAPFFMLLGRFFTLFASGPENVSYMVNVLSALMSAFTILFLFWTITHLAKKLVCKEGAPNMAQTIAILGSGLVGALAYTFSDTFWFSAVEGEVYGTSSLFTALVFWAILKWENEADEPQANRWIIFIAYLVGLSIGVHLLNLLAIPAIGLVYYFRKYEPTVKGTIAAILISGAVLGAIMYVLIPGFIKVASVFEKLFVNGFGMPYNTGVLIYSLVLIALLVVGIRYTIKEKKVLANTVLLSISVILIGYFSYATVVIRSSANPPMDQNNPDDVFSLLDYLNREQYGDRPLIFGQYYNAPLDKDEPYVDKRPYIIQKDGKYVESMMHQAPNYDKKMSTIFPRMYSRQGHHIDAYKSWANVKGHRVQTTGNNGEPVTLVKPTFGENLLFFWRYQVNWMYFRYFMWNFAGRQNDIQGNGDILRGNWISGIPFIDSPRLGDQSDLPGKWGMNKAHNQYYFLPLLLGLLGMFYQYNRGKKGQRDFFVVGLLFVMTGLAIVVYLNQTPMQPRERDYAYAGSFYAFAIWIGLGVLAISELLRKFTPATASGLIATVASLVLVPGIMASENWDDHDRSGRYTARATGLNYLNTCEENAIIFTNGDNDTFPLWYAQDVEGVRLDVRVCNLSYFQTDWYIDQMKRRAWNSAPLPISFTHDEYVNGTRDLVYIIDNNNIKGRTEVKDAIAFIKSDNPRTKLAQADNASFIPTRRLKITVDKEAVLRNGVVKPEDAHLIVDQIDIDLKGNYLSKDEMMILDMLANNNWERPFYFATTVGSDKYMNLEQYFQLEGFGYRIVPIKTPKTASGETGRVNTPRMYNNMINTFDWGNMGDPNVYLDENNMRMAMNIRNNFVRLAGSILDQGEMKAQEGVLNLPGEMIRPTAKDSAIAVLDHSQKMLPPESIPYDVFGIYVAENYLRAGASEKGVKIIRELMNTSVSSLDYYMSLTPRQQATIERDVQRPLYILRELSDVALRYNEQELASEVNNNFKLFVERFTKMQ